MKFLCDRCKTRYSIGDDRVRGKILKIRCKNCANVITVREGMSDADAGAPVDDASAPARAARPTTLAPKPAHTATAPPPANGVKPPPALDEEWYVSIDGDQSGPFSLVEAQKWVGAKPFDAELHCWSEGFDDWLPVDKVSHFRGVRKRPAGAPARPSTGRAAVAPVEDEPKPLFAATMASLERGVAEQQAQGGRLGIPNARATPAGGLPTARNGNGKPTPAKGNGTGSAPGPVTPGKSGPAAAAPPIPLATKPGATGPTPVPSAPTSPAAPAAPTAATPVASSKSGPVAAPATPAAAPKYKAKTGPVPKTKTGPTPVTKPARLQTQPGHTAAPAAIPAPGSGDVPAGSDTATSIGSQAYADPPAPAAAAPESGSMFPEPSVAPPADAHAEDDGLDIGEVSRVVNLADLMREGPKDRTGAVRRQAATSAAVNRTGLLPAVNRTGLVPAVNRTGLVPAMNRTASTPKIDPSMLGPTGSTGSVPAVTDASLLTPDALADAALPLAQPAPAPAQQRKSLVVLLAVAVLLLGGVGAVVAFALSRNDNDVQIGLGPTDQIDTTRPDDQGHHPFVPVPNAGSNVTHPNGNQNPIHRPNGGNPVGPTTQGSNGKVESDPLSPTSPLKPDEVEDMSGKQAAGASRCWERALRKQPYLQKDMKKVSVTITVDALGGVNNVQLAGVPSDDGGLGNCLQSFVRAWRFRQSSAGITAKFSMVFQNG